MADDEQPVPEGYTPFSTSTTDPSGATRTLTGYGPRAPIVPPSTPDLGPGVAAAFQNLPVDQAAKAVEAAMRYQAQRGYQRDLQSGMNAAQAFAKWGPMLFHQATGIPEAINRSVPPPITPQQMIQNRLAQQKFEAAQEVAKQRNAVAQAGLDLRRKAQEKTKSATITVPLDPSNPDGAKISGPADDPDVMEAVKKHEEASKPKPVPQEKSLLEKAKDLIVGKPAPARVKVKNKEGKVGTIPADQLDQALKQGFTEVK